MKKVVAVTGRRVAAPVLAVGLILTGCAPSTGVGAFTQEGRIGPNDGSDSCYAQAQALDNTGNFFGQDILTGAAAGAVGGGIIGAIAGGNLKSALIGAAAGAAVGGAAGYWEALQQQGANNAQIEATVDSNLTTENQQIDATQAAFNNDMDCRFQQAETIRQQYAAGQLTQDQAQTQMAQVKTWAQRDLALAQEINGNIQSRGAQFDTAVSNLDNGQPAPGSAAPTALNENAVISAPTPLYLRPDDSAPVVAQASRQEPVTVTDTSSGDYALVQTSDGTRGFAPIDDVAKPGTHHHIKPTPTTTATTASNSSSGGSVQQLDGSNAASRDAFAQSVSVSQSAVSNGFQLAG
jgi:hypothetical protein